MSSDLGLIDKVTAYCGRYGMLPDRGGTVIAAVSGGKDSMCMLTLLETISGMRGLRLVCAHFNHMLRGCESDADAVFVGEQCRLRGITFCGGAGDVAAFSRERKLGTEEAARDMRYAFLLETAKEYGARAVFTAHNMDDNAETVLLNLARGTGARGLGGIPPIRELMPGVMLARPMLCVTAAEIESFNRDNEVPFVSDSTNETDVYARNRIRHKVLPALKETREAFLENTLRASELLREDDIFLSSLAEAFIRENVSDGNALPAEKLRELPAPVFGRVVRTLAPGADFSHVGAVRELSLSRGPSRALDVPGMRITREYSTVRFGALKPETITARAISPGESFAAGKYRISCDIVGDAGGINSPFNIFCFDYDKICGMMSVGSWADGDKIKLSGAKHTKSLKKLFAEARIPACKRRELPVLSDEKGVIAVYGFGAAERCAASPGQSAVRVVITE